MLQGNYGFIFESPLEFSNIIHKFILVIKIKMSQKAERTVIPNSFYE